MSVTARVPALQPFRIRSFRFQWPADLLASWAFEMEGIILGWFVLISTGSVLLLALFGSLQFLGTLISPLYGMAGDRIGNRALLCLMRGTYLLVALVLMALFLTGNATPVAVFALSTIIGLVRPSDITMRNLLVGETMPAELLMRAMGISRTTADSARVVGALSGAGLVAALGSGWAYAAVCVVYAVSFALTFNVGTARLRVLSEGAAAGSSVLRMLKEGFAYVGEHEAIKMVLILALAPLILAQPYTSLLPVFAKDVLDIGSQGLGILFAAPGVGAVLGAVVVATFSHMEGRGKFLLGGAAAFGLSILGLAFSPTLWMALPLLAVSGFANTSYNALANSFLQMAAPPNMRGRVVSIYLLNRGLAPLGTLMAGALATWFDTRIALALMGGSCALLVAYIAVAARTVREIE